MQQLQTEIYSEVKKMIEDCDFEDMFYGYDSRSSLMNFKKIKDLRTFFRATQNKIRRAEKGSCVQ
jgi:hypothetical protein